MSEVLIIRGGVAVDWVTFTTYNKDAHDLVYRRLRADAEVLGQVVREARRMQYAGVGADYWFTGAGAQKKGMHYLIQVWGGRSHDFAMTCLKDNALEPELKCTRIDIQLTSDGLGPVDLPKLARYLRSSPREQWLFTGRAPRVDAYDNADGKHTLYIGSRSSARMVRAYNKEVEGGLAVRFEIEFKESLAEYVREQIVESGQDCLPKVMASEVFCMPGYVTAMLPMLRSLEAMKQDRMKVDYTMPDLTSTVNWILSSVAPSVERLMKTQYAHEVASALYEAMATGGLDAQDFTAYQAYPRTYANFTKLQGDS